MYLRGKYSFFHGSPSLPLTQHELWWRIGWRFSIPTGAHVVGVAHTTGAEVIIAATAQARAMLCAADDINFLSGPGKGVILIKLTPGADQVLGFIASTGSMTWGRIS